MDIDIIVKQCFMNIDIAKQGFVNKDMIVKQGFMFIDVIVNNTLCLNN